jgi:superkiller protein 3
MPPPGHAVTFDPKAQTPTGNPSLVRALRLIEAGDLAEAEQIIREVLRGHEDLAPAEELMGVVLGLRGDTEGARAAFERALKIDPAQSSALTKLGDIRLALNDVEGARRNFEAALAITPNDRQAHQRLGLLDEQAGQIDSAIQHFEQGLLGTSPDYLGVNINLALLYNQRGQYARSRDLLARFGGLTDRAPVMHRALASAYLGLGALKDAAAQYEIALALAPKDTAARIGLGIAYRDLGQKEKAVATHELAAGEAPGSDLANIELAKSRLAAGQNAQAVQGLEEAQKKSPANVQLALALADLYAAAGQRERAVSIYESKIAEGAAPPATYVSLGVIQQVEANLAAAETTFRKLLKAYPNSTEPYFRLGSLFGLQQRYKEALEMFDKGLALQPSSPRLLKAASLASLRLGDKNKAVEHARALVAVTNTADDQFFLATLLEGAGDIPAAIGIYRRVIEEAPEHWQAMNNLAYLLAKQGGQDAKEAVKLASQAAALASEQAVVTDTLGWSQLQSGDAAAALKTLLRAVQQEPRNANFHYHLALAQQALGDQAAARKSLGQALELRSDFPEARQTLEQLGRRR